MRPALLLFFVAFLAYRSAAQLCEAEEKQYAVGNTESTNPFVFFLKGGYPCAEGFYQETQVTDPVWMTLNLFSGLADPLKLSHMGLRHTRDDGHTDYLYSMTFGINAYTEDEEVLAFDNSNTLEAEDCDEFSDRNYSPDESDIWEGAVEIDTPASADVNTRFWWQANDTTDSYLVRVFWDCISFADKCRRTIAVLNIGDEPLYNVTIQLSFDFDITPRPSNEDLSFGTPNDTYTAVLDYSAVPAVELNVTFNDDGEFVDFDPESECWPEVSEDYSFEDDAECDAGCSVRIWLADELAEGEMVQIYTDLQFFDTTDDAEEFVDEEDNEVAFYCMGAGYDLDASPDQLVIAFLTYLPDAVCNYTSDEIEDLYCYLPGDCPCINGGTCVNEIVGECECVEDYYGEYCELWCSHNGMPYEDEDSGDWYCDCEEGWWSEDCSEDCICEAGSLCEDDSGECWCRDGYRGEDCTKRNVCRGA